MVVERRGPSDLRPQCGGIEPTRGDLRGQNPQRGEAGRPADAAAGNFRADDQSQSCQDARPHRAALAARPRRRGDRMKRRDFITLLGGAALTWPRDVHAQQLATPVIGFLSSRSPGETAPSVAAFRTGLAKAGYVEGQNVTIECRWAEGRYEQLPALAADLVRRQVAVIVATGGEVSALAAKAATSTIPIVFTSGGDPVNLGLVASLNRPGGNATGDSLFFGLFAPKRLELLQQLVPKAAVFGVLVNPGFPSAEQETKDMLAAGRTLGRQVHIMTASTEGEIDAAFGTLIELRVQHRRRLSPSRRLRGADSQRR